MRRFGKFLVQAVQAQPVQAIGGLLMTAVGVNYKNLLAALIAEPPWYLQSHWVQFSLLISAVLILAYVFWHQAESERPSKDRPDIDAREAFKKLLNRSRHSRKLIKNGLPAFRVYESMLTPAGIIEARLHIAMEGDLLDSLRQGRVRSWGVPRDSRAEKEIDQEEWHHLELVLDKTTLEDYRHTVVAMDKSRNHSNLLRYAHIRFCSRDLFREYPLTIWPRRIDYVPLERQFEGDQE